MKICREGADRRLMGDAWPGQETNPQHEETNPQPAGQLGRPTQPEVREKFKSGEIRLPPDDKLWFPWPRRYFSGVVMLGCVGIGLFWLAGRWSWLQGWALLLFIGLFVTAITIWLGRTNPDLLAERRRVADNVEPWDKVLVRVYSVLLMSMLFVAALDAGRYGWSSVPAAWQAAGWLGLCLVAAMVWHVMSVNNFLSSWARIQDDRGHVVVTRGAYGWIRHPMYLAGVISAFSIPLLLGSWWALIPGVLAAALLFVRTALEDRMLMDKLDGYREYAATVRYRLLRGIW